MVRPNTAGNEGPLRGEPPTTLAEPSLELSTWFTPFLSHFIRETEAAGGDVCTIEEDRRMVGLLLADPTENVASVFTRSRSIAEELLRPRKETSVFSEIELGTSGEEYLIYSLRLEPGAPAHRFRHPVRIASPSEIPGVLALLREVYGPVNDRWFAGIRSAAERCFVVTVLEELVGTAWLSVVGAWSRLHSLTVRPGHRGLGIGTDLLQARLLWARQEGVQTALSEIAEGNLASRAIAERAGMRPVGRLFLYRRS